MSDQLDRIEGKLNQALQELAALKVSDETNAKALAEHKGDWGAHAKTIAGWGSVLSAGIGALLAWRHR